MGFVGVVQVDGGWWNGGAEKVLVPPMGPGRKSVGVRGCPLTPGPTEGGTGAALGPRKQFGGSTGATQATLWWCWGVPLTPRTT